jgi:polyisoprenyl-phosphate glycosyltransferase
MSKLKNRKLKKLPTLSIVVPCFNEEEVIRDTHARLLVCAKTLPFNTEIIYVDDGSSDHTLSILRNFTNSKNSKVTVVALSRNYGHQLALTAGLDVADSDVVAVIDSDLQDPPECLAEMLELWKKGNDVVYGVRRSREGEGNFKLLTAKYFYRIMNAMSDTSIPLDTGDFRVMDRRVVKALCSMRERDRFIRGMVAWAGYTSTPYYYDRKPRAAGVSKYPFWKMVRFAVNGIISFSMVPLKIATWIGLVAAAMSMLGIFYTIYIRLFENDWVSGWAFLSVIIMFFAGVQLFCIGIIGEYVGRTYQQSKERPLYLVKELINRKKKI